MSAHADHGSFMAGLWRLADPKVSLASFAGLFLGGAAAGAAGAMHWGWFAATVAGIFALEVAKNASGEVFDFDSGVDQAVREEDRSRFSGGKRVMVDGLLTRTQTWRIAGVCYGVAIAAGLAIAAWREPRVLWLGLAGTGLAWFYHAPPLRLAYRGFGEGAVAVSYGPLITLGVFVVQRSRWDAPLALLSSVLGLLIAAFLLANEIPDLHADRAGGKWNLVARLGRARGAWLFALVSTSAWGILLALVWYTCNPALLAACAGLPASAWSACRLVRDPERTPAVVPAQAAALIAFLLFALGAGTGLLLRS